MTPIHAINSKYPENLVPAPIQYILGGFMPQGFDRSGGRGAFEV